MTRKSWTPEEDSLLRELTTSNRLSYRQMAAHFPGRTGTSLMKRALNYLEVTRDGYVFFKHSYNRNFFSIPNPVNCYVAGFYVADGCITDNPTTRVLAMELSHLEWHQLETFKRLMEYSGSISDSSYAGREKMCALRLYSAYQLAADLEKNFGLTPNKTHRLPAPNLTDPHLQLCYLAGLLDGDGCVCISNQGRLAISYTSSSLGIIGWVKTFVESLNLDRLSDKGGKVRKVATANAYTYQVAGLKAIDLIHRVQKLKPEGVPILDRKWDNERLNSYIAAFEAKHGIVAPNL